jgi:hypothetical protein
MLIFAYNKEKPRQQIETARGHPNHRHTIEDCQEVYL